MRTAGMLLSGSNDRHSHRRTAARGWAICALFLMAAPLAPAAELVSLPVPLNPRGNQLAEQERLLREQGVAPDAPGLKRFLAAIRPTAAHRRQVQAWVRQLGDSRFAPRVEATRALHLELVRRPHLARVELTQAIADDDAEIRHRVQAILLDGDGNSGRVLLAALQVIALRPVPGLAAEVLQAIPYCDTPTLQAAARRALRATVEPHDASRMRAWIATGGNSPIRLAAIAALEQAAGADSLRDLRPLLSDADEAVRLAAATAVVNHRPLEALEVAASLLESDVYDVRAGAAALLRAASGERFEYSPYDDIARRSAAATRWQAWVRDRAPSAALRLPVVDAAPKQGRAMVVTFNPFQSAEVALRGETLAQWDAAESATGCVVLPNGERVLADWGGDSLIFLAADGRMLRSCSLPGTPNGLDLLDNGNLLVPLFHEQLLIEMTPAGQIVHQIALTGRPTDARRLAGGNTLLAIHTENRVIEINRFGEVVWSIEGIRSPESARRLDNGHTLVADQVGVREFDAAGNQVWSLDNIHLAYDAVLLDNGRLLIGHGSGLSEITREGDVIREFSLGTVRRIFYY